MTSDDVPVSKGLGFPVEAMSGVGGSARQERKRARGCAGVFCGCVVGDAAAGDWGGDGRFARKFTNLN